MADVEYRRLEPDDELILEQFLRPLADSSMFLRANAFKGGLIDQGQPLQGTYVGAIEAGRLVGVAAHFWNGMINPQGEGHLAGLLGELARHSPRAITGLIGPKQQVQSARGLLGLSAVPCKLAEEEGLFSLDLEELRVPPDLFTGKVRCRRAFPPDLNLQAEWRHDYMEEALGERPGAELLARAREDIQRSIDAGTLFLLFKGEKVVASSAFNATLPDIVQVGGVWTPRKWRGRGYGRAVVAGALRIAWEKGARRSVLFTGNENLSAQRAYTAIGYQRTGEYAIVLFREPQPFR